MGIFTIIAVIVSVISGVASYVQAKKAQAAAKKGNDQGILITKQDNNAGLTIIYGERRVGGVKVFKDVNRLAVQPAVGRTLIGQNLNGIDSTYVQKEVRIFLDRVDVIGEGPIHSVTDIEIDGDAWTHNRYDQNDHMSYRGIIMDGSAGQAYLSELGAVYPRWNSTSVGDGVAYVQSRFRNQAGYQVYSGEPNVQYQVKGKLIYDPRKDTAYGGVGTHNAATKSTWEWSDNPSLCLLDYLTNDYGRGLSINEINVPSFITAANSCDTLVDIPAPLTNTTGGIYYRYDRVTGEIIEVPINTAFPDYRSDQVGTTQKRLTCNVALDPDEEVLNNVKKLLDSMKGNLPYHQGKYSLRLEDAGSSVMAIDEDDIIGGIAFGDGDQSERFNRVTVKFPNKSKRFNMDQVSWPKLGSTEYNAYLAEDQDQQLWHEIEVSAVTDFYQAEDIAEYIVRNSRAAMSCEVRVKSKGILLEPSDIITITHSTPAWTNKKFRVRGIKIGTDFTCTLSLSEYQASVYQWSDTANEPDSPDTDMPRPTDPLPALSGLSATVGRVDSADGVPQGLVTLTWNPIVDFEVDEYVLRYKQTSETVFQVVRYPETSRPQDVDPSLSFIAPQHNVTYDIYLSYTVTSTSRSSTVVTTSIVIPEYRTDLDIEVHDIELENGIGVTEELSGELLSLGGLSDVAVSFKAAEIVINENATLLESRMDQLELDLGSTDLSGIVANANALSLLAITLDDTIDGVDANAVSLTQLGLTVDSHTTGLAASALAVDAIELDIIATDANVLSSANKISTLELTVDDPTTGVSATANSLAQTKLDVNAVDGRVTTSATDISGLETTVSDPSTGLVTRVGVTEGYGARIDTVDGQIVDLGAEYFVKLDVNNNVSGFGLVNNGSSSEFKILANKFTIVDPAAPTNATATPFVVSGGVTYMQNVVVGNTVIANDAITTDKINVTDLSAISANLGTVTAGTMKTASSGYRVEVSDAGDFPIWYGTGSKTAGNGLFYVKKDGSVFINAVVNAQAGSSIQSLDVQCSISNTIIYQNAPATAQTLASSLLYTYTNGSGNYTYKWTKQAQLTSASQTISNTTIQKPVFTTSAVARNDQSITSWEVKVTDTTTGGTFRETVFVRFINVGSTQ